MKTKVEDMDLYTLKRLGALLDGLDLIDGKAEELGVSIELRRHHLIRYIDEVTEKVRVRDI